MLKLGLLAAAAGVAAGLKWDELKDRPEYSYDHWIFEGRATGGRKHAGTREAFEANLAFIREHNANPARTWTASVNEFTALWREEFKARVVGRGYNPSGPHMMAAKQNALNVEEHLPTLQPVSALPASVDWRKKGVVTPVKDQGMCGGCWSFSAAETTESAVAIATGKLLTFSEQELIDCAPNPNSCGGTGGCNGATQEIGFQYYVDAGVTTEADYPYTASTGSCNRQKIHPVANITGYVFLPPNNYSAIMNVIANVGPVAISADAEPWQFYDSGVFSSDCGTDVDHAIQLVGYGTDATSKLDYYLVRNSWGAGWGEDGYIRVARYGSSPQGEPCGTDPTPGDGDGCSGGPSSIEVCGLCGILSDSSYPVGAQLNE